MILYDQDVTTVVYWWFYVILRNVQWANQHARGRTGSGDRNSWQKSATYR